MWEIWKHQPAEINLRALINQINQKLNSLAGSKINQPE